MKLDLGSDHMLKIIGWSPDRDLNPQFDGIPDEPRAVGIIDHLNPSGEPCSGGVTFDTPTMRQVRPETALWQVESWDPLTISPSVLCSCGDHGFIRNGRWESA